MIAITGLTKSYGATRVLQGLDLSVAPGEVVLLVGANGSGKTTTLRVLAGLSKGDAGRVVIAGHDMARRGEALAALSYLPQSPRFDERLTPTEILRFYARLRGVPAARANRVAADWDLDEFLKVPAGRLSGGTRQRLALAVFDLPNAPVLVLDEPGLSLDPRWRREMQVRLRGAARNGRAVLVATHLLGEWEGEADRCLVLEAGRVARQVSPSRLRAAMPAGRVPVASGHAS
jgi:ABC-type multidrug transport system ATPase subunit